jgi:hypothetical protein
MINHAIAEYFFPSRFYYWVKHHGWISAVAAESADVVFSLLRAMVRWAAGRDPSPRLARLTAPIFRFPERPLPLRFAGEPISDEVRGMVVRNAGEEDAPGMAELLSRAFDRWPAREVEVSPLEHLRWRMRSDRLAPRHQWVAEIDGKIAAMAGNIFRRLRVRGRDYLAREGVDSAVDPQYQVTGLYAAMVDRVRESPHRSDTDLGFSFMTNPVLLQRRRRRGRKPLANPIQVLEKPYRPRAVVARRRKRYGGRLPEPLAALRIGLQSALHRLRHVPYRDRARCHWSITTLERFDDRIDDFFDEAARPFDFLVVRSRDYMNWRYCEPAAGRFTIRVAEQEGKILGYLVFKISSGNGYIADLLALPERLDVVRSLIEDTLRLFREARTEMVSCWMIAQHPYNDLLRRCGFVDSRSDLGFVYKAVTLDPKALEFLEEATARVHLMQGDSDWI